jgi:hypothetical protein
LKSLHPNEDDLPKKQWRYDLFPVLDNSLYSPARFVESFGEDQKQIVRQIVDVCIIGLIFLE